MSRVLSSREMKRAWLVGAFAASLAAGTATFAISTATPRGFTAKHHIGNLQLVAMQVKNGQWLPLNWHGKHPSDILKRYE